MAFSAVLVALIALPSRTRPAPYPTLALSASGHYGDAVVEGETLKGQPLNHADLFHTGIVVDDLASAKEELGAVPWA